MNRRKFLLSSVAAGLAGVARGEAGGAIRDEFGAQDAAGGDLTPQLREKLMHDPLRPQFHLLPRANWMNDPCAPRYYRGKYHMFFQYNPHAAVWGDMHWNHATSVNLIHWKHLPIAIAPTPGSYDAYGIFTGSALPGAAVPTVLYTGVTRTSKDQETIRGEGLREVQCLATSSDPDLRTWTKLEKPVIEAPPPGLKVTGFRDPCPWKEGDTWYLGVGSGFANAGGAVLLYRSSDGRQWEYLHPLAEGKWNGQVGPDGRPVNPVDSGEMWECPDFFPLGGKHVLLYSVERKVYWEVGSFDPRGDLKFHSEKKGLLDHGSYYAMKSMEDAKGRRILWGWVQETRSAQECEAAGWAGSMALPRVLTLGADNTLRMETPPELASLRRKTQQLRLPKNAVELAELKIQDRAGEIVCAFQAGDSPCGLELRNGDAGALFAVKYGGTKATPTISINEKTIPLSPDKDGVSTIHLWLDGSVVEVFLDGREAMTSRCYTPSTGEIHVAWTGGMELLRSLTVSAVTPISDDRLTS